jgi:2-dehydro-3-deoxyphosphogluconate aldolase/(4S)-4-hydroxy-2-oxoglutarate aldolase
MATDMTYRTVAILRGHEPQQTAHTARRCWDLGMDLVEVPVQGERGWAALERVGAIADGRVFGAGTVLSVADVHRARDLGATVIISPGVDRDVVEAALAAGAVPMPGVMTPTEVGMAAGLGLTTCKLFPASVVGPDWLGAMRGPFPSMRFVAVGGVDTGNAAEFIRAGAAGVAFGSSVESLLAGDGAAEYIREIHRLLDPGTATGAELAPDPRRAG